MPKPNKGESKKDFIGRCIPILIDEGKEQEQAVAICYSLWERKDEMIEKKIDGFLKEETDESEIKYFTVKFNEIRNDLNDMMRAYRTAADDGFIDKDLYKRTFNLLTISLNNIDKVSNILYKEKIPWRYLDHTKDRKPDIPAKYIDHSNKYHQ